MTLHKNGAALILIANLFFGFLPITVRWADQMGYSSFETTFFRFTFAGLSVFALALLGWQRLRAVNPKALVLRGLFGAITVLTYFLSLHWTTAAKACLLNNGSPIWGNIYAVVLLKHRPGKGFVPLVAMAMVGVALVLGVGFTSLNVGDVIGVVSGMMSGAGALATREARRSDNALTVFGSFTFFGFFLSAFFLLLGPHMGDAITPVCHWAPIQGMGWWVLLAMAVLSMTGQMLYTQGCIHTTLAMGTLLSLMVPLLAAIFGIIFLHEPVAPHFVLGTVLVLTACGLFGWKSKAA